MAEISVLLPVYNGEQFLRQAIESILVQTYDDFELLVIDDGSTDSSGDIVRSYDDPRVRLFVNRQNLGLPRTLNKGLSLARGSLIARQDADDISRPTRFEAQVRYMTAHPDVVLLGGQAKVIDKHGRPTGRHMSMPLDAAAIRWRLLFGNPFVHSSVLFRRADIWVALGGYNEQYYRAQDLELWSRVLAAYEAANLPETLLDHRIRTNSLGARQPAPRALIAANLGRFSGLPEIPPTWPGMVESITTGRIEDPQAIMQLVATLFDTFCQSQSVAESRLKSKLADLYATIAYKLAMSDRRLASLAALRHAVQADPNVVRRGIGPNVSPIKYLARWVGGSRIGAQVD